MPTVVEQSPGSEPQMPQIVRERLLSIDWGVDSYPQELLELNEDEARILGAISGGKSVIKVAEEEGVGDWQVYPRYYSAQGKQEAKAGLGGDILGLSELAQRVVVLNSIFGDESWNSKTVNVVTNRSTEAILMCSNVLDELLGDSWKRCPKLLMLSSETIRSRVQQYDERLSPNWRWAPVILTLAQAKVEERAAIYDEWFGDQWYVCPALLTNIPETVASSARALKTIGIQPGDKPTKKYFNLLVTNVANKRRKAAFIRKAILGHSQVRVVEAKRSKSEIVKERQAQSPIDRQKEADEIEELKVFIRHLGARGLSQSLESIWTWAKTHNYVPSHATFEEPPVVKTEKITANILRQKPEKPSAVEAEPNRVEVRAGKEFRVYVLPEKKRRTKKTRK